MACHDIAFNLTQDVFPSLWERRRRVEFRTSVSGFRYASVRYQMINQIDKDKVRSKYRQEFTAFRSNLAEKLRAGPHDLQEAVNRSLEKIPVRCQGIFRMSRMEHMSSTEIAEQLNISHCTVEN